MSANIEVGIICQCGAVFKQIINFCNHSKKCNKWIDATAEDPQLREIVEQWFNLKPGALA